jgi:hypothetical protein
VEAREYYVLRATSNAVKRKTQNAKRKNLPSDVWCLLFVFVSVVCHNPVQWWQWWCLDLGSCLPSSSARIRCFWLLEGGVQVQAPPPG